MRTSTFKFCMTFAAVTLIGVALFYFVSYLGVKIAIGNSGLKPFYQQTVSALWLTYGSQSLLIGILYAIVAWHPHSVSREVIVILGLVQLVEAVLLLTFAGSLVAAVLLSIAALFVLVGALIWPREAEAAIDYPEPAAPPPAPPN